MVQRHHWGLTALVAAALTACGGGTSNSAPTMHTASAGDSTDTPTYLDGTAAYAAPMAGASITITDVNGHTVTTAANDAGDYRADVSGFSAPLLVTATANVGDAVRIYHALVAANVGTGTIAHANVTPLTEAIVSLASSDGSTPGEFSGVEKLQSLNLARLLQASELIKAGIQNVAAATGNAGYDPLTTPFAVDGISGGFQLLEALNVAIDERGVTLRVIGIPVDDSATGAAANALLTLKDAAADTPAPLPAPTITDRVSAFDPWVAGINQCLGQPPALRVATDSDGKPTTLLGNCAQINGFAANYLNNGYTLLQQWGQQLATSIPEGAVMGRPEVIGFFRSDAGEETALLRFTYSSPTGGGSTIETAHKLAGNWLIEGNQRAYDAGIAVRLARSIDLSTNPWRPGIGPDAGKRVGWFNAFSPRLLLQFRQGGPNASAVYAVRVKGPGLPAAGIVLARSSACGAGEFLSTYSNDGSLPTAPAPDAAVMPMPATGVANRYTLSVIQNGNAYTGTDFYNEWRGRNTDGSPSTSRSTMVAPSPGVDLSTIPPLARYAFEVFKAGASTPADTFSVRATTRPVSGAFGTKLPWAQPTAEALQYIQPANKALAAALDSASLSWTTPAGAPSVIYATLYGSGLDGAVTRATEAGSHVHALGDTHVTVLAAAARDGNGQPCAYPKIPAFSTTSGTRELHLRQSSPDGLVLQSISQHLARSTPVP